MKSGSEVIEHVKESQSELFSDLGESESEAFEIFSGVDWIVGGLECAYDMREPVEMTLSAGWVDGEFTVQRKLVKPLDRPASGSSSAAGARTQEASREHDAPWVLQNVSELLGRLETEERTTGAQQVMETFAQIIAGIDVALGEKTITQTTACADATDGVLTTTTIPTRWGE